ncbi:MAPEG family protein [Limibacillus halophilus]|jgi:uncharacterized membrane protein YecN with MAPEG domain
MYILAAALLGLLHIVLTLRAIRLRRANKVALGDGGQELLQRAIRVQGNFSENAPLGLLLSGVLFFLGWEDIAGGLALLLLLGRTIHAVGVSRSPEDYRYRVTGMVLTFTSIGGSGLLLIACFLLQQLAR